MNAPALLWGQNTWARGGYQPERCCPSDGPCNQIEPQRHRTRRRRRGTASSAEKRTGFDAGTPRCCGSCRSALRFRECQCAVDRADRRRGQPGTGIAAALLSRLRRKGLRPRRLQGGTGSARACAGSSLFRLYLQTLQPRPRVGSIRAEAALARNQPDAITGAVYS